MSDRHRLRWERRVRRGSGSGTGRWRLRELQQLCFHLCDLVVRSVSRSIGSRVSERMGEARVGNGFGQSRDESERKVRSPRARRRNTL